MADATSRAQHAAGARRWLSAMSLIEARSDRDSPRRPPALSDHVAQLQFAATDRIESLWPITLRSRRLRRTRSCRGLAEAERSHVLIASGPLIGVDRGVADTRAKICRLPAEVQQVPWLVSFSCAPATVENVV